MSDTTPCYVGRCPECMGKVAVTVVDISDPCDVRSALRDRAGMERRGLQVFVQTVSEFNNSAWCDCDAGVARKAAHARRATA